MRYLKQSIFLGGKKDTGKKKDLEAASQIIILFL